MGIFDVIRNRLSGNPNQSQLPDIVTPSTQNISFAPSTGADYPESFYRQQTDIRKVNSQEDMSNFIETALLSRRCKDALKSLVANLYDDNIILSYHANSIEAEIAYLKSKVYLKAFVQANSYKSDVLNPVWGLVVNNIYYQLELRFTRTIAGDRERVLQGKIVQSHEINQFHPYNRGGSGGSSPCTKIG